MECHQIIEFENKTIEKLQEQIAKKHHFVIYNHKLELYGCCQRCSARKQLRKPVAAGIRR
jgi:Fur family ferric uptake transcriptional regulator